MRVNVLMTGLDQDLAAELSRALAELRYTVVAEPFRSARESIKAIDRAAANLVFCAAEPSAYEPLLNGLREMGRLVPVVVVSRLPEVDDWLDAMEAGAADYCAAPFEPRLIRSIVHNAVRYPRSLAAAC
ncbi:MAG: hypothetical protein ACM336_13785 [Acidobacteriota bacterium]